MMKQYLKSVWKAWWFGICCSLLFGACHKSDSVEPESGRTVLVYIAGDNSLSTFGYININEMLLGMRKTSGRLVIYFDSADGKPCLLTIKGGKNCVIDTVATYPEENSASVSVMQRVMADTRRLFPSDSYGMILWSHGMGWLPEYYSFPGSNAYMQQDHPYLMTKYFGIDEQRGEEGGKDCLEVNDLAEALPEGLDFILFDACFMSSVEVLYALRSKADYFIASPAEVIGNGFPYEEMMPLLWGSVNELKQICVTFYNFYNDHADPDHLGWNSATVALIESGELEGLMASAREILKGQTDFQSLDVWRYPLSYSNLPNVFYDLGDYVRQVATAGQWADFQVHLERTVIYKAATAEFFFTPIPADQFSGLSTYLPLDRWGAMNTAYFTLDWPRQVYDK